MLVTTRKQPQWEPILGRNYILVNSLNYGKCNYRIEICARVLIIDQLHTRAKEFNWRDVTSGCSFAATYSIAVNGKIGRWTV